MVKRNRSALDILGAASPRCVARKRVVGNWRHASISSKHFPFLTPLACMHSVTRRWKRCSTERPNALLAKRVDPYSGWKLRLPLIGTSSSNPTRDCPPGGGRDNFPLRLPCIHLLPSDSLSPTDHRATVMREARICWSARATDKADLIGHAFLPAEDGVSRYIAACHTVALQFHVCDEEGQNGNQQIVDEAKCRTCGASGARVPACCADTGRCRYR